MGHAEGGQGSEKPSPEGGMVLKNLAGRGPYLLKTVNLGPAGGISNARRGGSRGGASGLLCRDGR
jgi:hypothetical protein